MLYDVSTPKEYFDQLEADWRQEKLMAIREMILTYGTEFEECIEYKMLCYRSAGKAVFNLNAQKSYVSLYVGNIDKVPNAGDLLKGINRGKGCIRVSKTLHLIETGIEQFIKNAIDLHRSGGESDC